MWIIYLLGAGLLAVLLFKKLQHSPKALIRNSNKINTHRWDVIQDNSLSYCNHCQKALSGWFRFEGLQCKICKISCHNLCTRKSAPCKQSSSDIYKDSLLHDWKEIFIPKDLKCAYCSSLCGSAYSTTSVQCIWCTRSSHKKCIDLVNSECDGGSCKKFIIHPSCVKIPLKISKIGAGDEPIIVVINPKSGGQSGEIALQAFYTLLNPVQVIDVFNDPSAIKAFQKIENLKILVAGGDGTVAKLLNTLYDEKWEGEIPPVGVFPLGTGNDLSIVFNWGKGLKSRKGKNLYCMVEAAQNVLKSVSKSYPSSLDRWTIEIHSAKSEKHIMCNYFGLGVDAKIAYDFHNLRESRPYLFKSRVIFT